MCELLRSIFGTLELYAHSETISCSCGRGRYHSGLLLTFNSGLRDWGVHFTCSLPELMTRGRLF